jgi:hypothetical protein
VSWVEVVIAAAATGLGLLAGHWRAGKVATKLSRVLALARDAAYLVGQVLHTFGAVSAAEVVARWSEAFADALATAGLDLTEAQHSAAVAAARQELGRYAMAAGMAALRREIDKFEVEWPSLKAKIDEQALVRKRAAAAHAATVKGRTP